jgi:hypothetical protein
MDRESHRLLEQKVVSHLKAAGYPPAALVFEPILLPADAGHRYRPDLGILDPERNEFLAVIEVKARVDAAVIEHTAAQLTEYVEALGSRQIPAFLAVTNVNSDAIELFRLGADGKLAECAREEFPSYAQLRSAGSASSKTAVRAGVERTTDRFRLVAWILAFVLLAIVAADVYFKELHKVSVLTPERLTLIGISIALVLLPYAAKLKAFGLEFERVTPTKVPPAAV